MHEPASCGELIALGAGPPPVEPSVAQRIARELYGLRAFAQPLGGERDCNFRLSTDHGQFVLKLLDPGASAVIVDGQRAVLTHLAAAAPHLAIPRLIRTSADEDVGHTCIDGRCWSVILTTYLQGTLFVRSGELTHKLLWRVGEQLAQLDVALLSFDHPALEQRIAWDVRHAPALLEMLPYIETGVRPAIQAALANAPQTLEALSALSCQAIHGDGHPGNLLILACDESAGHVGETPSRVGIIDFGDMIRAPLVQELAVALAGSLIDGVASPTQLPRLLAGYVSVRGLEASAVDLLFDLIAIRIAIGPLIQAGRARSAARTCTADTASLAALQQLAATGRRALTAAFRAQLTRNQQVADVR